MNEIIHLPKRIDLIAMLPQGSVIAEIGVWRGYFSCEMLNLPNLGHLYLIDAWKSQPGYNDPLSDADHEANLAETKRNISGHIPGGRVTIIRADSDKAVTHEHFKEQPRLDAIFLDADHSYDAVLRDLRYWVKFVKPNGWIMGHDYTNNAMSQQHKWGVIPAVADFCDEFGWKLTHLTDEDFASFGLRKA